MGRAEVSPLNFQNGGRWEGEGRQNKMTLQNFGNLTLKWREDGKFIFRAECIFKKDGVPYFHHH